MRGLAIVAALASSLMAPSVFAQGAAAARPPAPAQAATPAPALPPPPPFPAGAKFAFVNLQAIAQLTTEGKVAATKVNTLAQKKQNEGADKAKALQSNQARLQTSGSVMSDTARALLEKEVERQQLEGQRFEQDAQAELNELQEQLQKEFQAKLLPVLEVLAKEKGVQALYSAGDAGVIWIEPGIDLTLEAVKRMDASKPGAK